MHCRFGSQPRISSLRKWSVTRSATYDSLLLLHYMFLYSPGDSAVSPVDEVAGSHPGGRRMIKGRSQSIPIGDTIACTHV